MVFISLSLQEVEEVKTFIRDSTYPPTPDLNKRVFRRRASNFRIDERTGRLLFFRSSTVRVKFFATEELVEKLEAVKLIHYESGHPGRNRLKGLVDVVIYGVSRDNLMAVLNSCAICGSRRVMTTRPPIIPINAMFPRERIIIDLVDFRAYSSYNMGYKWLLVAVDSFSKYGWTFKLYDKRGETVAYYIERIIYQIDCPFIIHTDNGKEFLNQNIRALQERFGFRHVRGRVRCPWMQGQVEKLNQTLKFSISAACFGLNLNFHWIAVYESVTYNYNRIVHETTRQAPFAVLFGVPAIQRAADYYDEEHVNRIDNQLLEWENEDIENNANNLEGFFDTYVYQETEEIREAATRQRNISMDRMVRASAWPNEIPAFEVGDQVVRRVYTDANRGTRRGGLNEHHDYHVYTIFQLLEGQKALIVRDADSSVFFTLPQRDLRKIEPIN